MTDKNFEVILSALAAQLESKEAEILCLKYDVKKLKKKINELEKETKNEVV